MKSLLHNTILHPRYLAHRELQKIIKLEAAELTGKLLDIGCGKKPYHRFLTQVDHHYGIDVPTTMHGETSIDTFASALALPFKEGSFDSVLCTEVLEHVPDPLLAFQLIANVMKPGGKLLVTVPFSEQLHEEPYDYYRFTEYSLRYLAEKSGFLILRMHRRGGMWLEIGYRMSSFLYSTLGAHRSESGELKPKILFLPLVLPLCAAIQLAASVLDACWPSRLGTIGYGFIAERL